MTEATIVATAAASAGALYIAGVVIWQRFRWSITATLKRTASFMDSESDG